MAETRARRWLLGSALGAWLLGCALIASARWTWVGELASHARPFMGLAGLALAGLLCAVKWRRLAAAACLSSVWLLVPLLSFLPYRELSQHSGPTLRVATINLHRERPAVLDLEGWLERNPMDVIAFQELTLPTAQYLRELLEADGTVTFLPAEEDRWARSTYGQVLFTRLPVQRLESVHGGWRGPGFLRASLRFAGAELNILACQVLAPGGSSRFDARLACFGALAERAADSPLTVVLGDLNSTSFSPHFRDLLELGGLHDSRVGIGWQPSFSPLEFSPWALPLLAIDHVLIGDGLLIIDRATVDGLGSDHLPVVATLGLATRD